MAASIFHWEVVGGAPLKKGGVQTKAAATKFYESATGVKALYKAGFNTPQVTALENKAKAGGVRSCQIPPNVIMPSMVSKNFSVKYNVELDGNKYPNGIPGWCLDATRTYTSGKLKVKQDLHAAAAETCANALMIQAIKTTETQTHTPVKPAPKPVPVPATPNTPAQPVCSGDTTNSNTGTAAQGGNCSTNSNKTNCSIINSTNSSACNTTINNFPPTPNTPNTPNTPTTPGHTITMLTTAEPVFQNSPELVCVRTSDSTTGGVVTWKILNGPGSIPEKSIPDPQGDPTVECSTFESDSTIGSTTIEATDTNPNGSVPASADITISTQQDSGF
jgi:hypothetical protein